MKIVKDLLPNSSRMHADMAVQFLMERPENIPEFIDACDLGTGKIPMRSSRVIYILGQLQPQLLEPYLSRVLEIAGSTSDESVVRNFLCLLEERTKDFSEAERDQLVNLGFRKIEEPCSSIVIRPISLKLLASLSEFYPELKAEIYSMASKMMDDPYPSYRSTAKKILKRLKKEITSPE